MSEPTKPTKKPTRKEKVAARKLDLAAMAERVRDVIALAEVFAAWLDVMAGVDPVTLEPKEGGEDAKG